MRRPRKATAPGQRLFARPFLEQVDVRREFANPAGRECVLVDHLAGDRVECEGGEGGRLVIRTPPWKLPFTFPSPGVPASSPQDGTDLG